MNDQRLPDLQIFYDLLSAIEKRCGGKQRLADCHGRLDWPRRGVYFFFEAGEDRDQSGTGPRVVCIGTHALSAGSSSKLWGRLSQHRGSNRGTGNHRGSIFRLLIGEALLARAGRQLSSWGASSTLKGAAETLGRDIEDVRAEEAPMEAEVSRYIGSMPFVWIDIDDEPGSKSFRGFIERNSIALLSNYGCPTLDSASPNWLGQASGRRLVRESGLWNNNYVREDYDRTFLNQLARIGERLGNSSRRLASFGGSEPGLRAVPRRRPEPA